MVELAVARQMEFNISVGLTIKFSFGIRSTRKVDSFELARPNAP